VHPVTRDERQCALHGFGCQRHATQIVSRGPTVDTLNATRSEPSGQVGTEAVEVEELAKVAKNGSIRARMHAQPAQTLAPAAGAGIGKELADRLLARADFITQMETAAIDGLNAVHPKRWDPASKSWGEPEPDHKTRIATLFGLLAQMEGEPVKRILHVHGAGGGMPDPLQAMQDSPALRRAARHLLEKAEFRERNAKAKPAELTIEE
jgi:hypothetical protein